jgi:hypothetical protein
MDLNVTAGALIGAKSEMNNAVIALSAIVSGRRFRMALMLVL